ncbi:MAG TPA: polyketide synthase, partial [Longimicrobiaceae bacterium]
MSESVEAGAQRGAAIAVIGMAGRFPGAGDVERFWSNLRQGVHAIRFFSERELEEAGVPPALLRDPAYVRAGGVLEDSELFDAAFFGFTPREAEIMDPQHRVFLETAWEALESAGYAPGTIRETVGIYAGSSAGDYLSRVTSRPELVEAVGGFQAYLANGRDFLVTRAAHR